LIFSGGVSRAIFHFRRIKSWHESINKITFDVRDLESPPNIMYCSSSI
jgi:hypothetical protein